MTNFLKRYHRYIVRKAAEAPPSFVSDMRWQALPWFLPLAAGALVVWARDVKWPYTLYLFIPLGGLWLIGTLYVCWIFIAEGVDRYRKAKGRKPG